jgi:hypothetical protein
MKAQTVLVALYEHEDIHQILIMVDIAVQINQPIHIIHEMEDDQIHVHGLVLVDIQDLVILV